MNDEAYKAGIIRILPTEPELPLTAPPAESFDLLLAGECPNCGSPDAVVQKVEDAEVATCPRCQSEFSPRLESVSRKVIRQVSERRARRFARFMQSNI